MRLFVLKFMNVTAEPSCSIHDLWIVRTEKEGFKPGDLHQEDHHSITYSNDHDQIKVVIDGARIVSKRLWLG